MFILYSNIHNGQKYFKKADEYIIYPEHINIYISYYIVVDKR